MRAKRATLLNRLVHELPERYVVDAAWLTRLGLSASSIRDYVERGWLERVGSRLNRRPEPGDGGPVRWGIAPLSLQTLLEVPVPVDRKSVVWGKSGSVRVDVGGRRPIEQQNKKTK